MKKFEEKTVNEILEKYDKGQSITSLNNLYHYMYKNCDDLYLSRKKEIFENFIKERGSETIITNPTNNKEYLNLCYVED